MITNLKISGFKSFHDYEMTFTPLTVIAGVNASGKSNLFDALHLLARLAETDLKTAFSEQRGNPDELFTQFENGGHAKEMKFTVEMLVNRKVKDNWGDEDKVNNTRLRYELHISRSESVHGFPKLHINHESLEKIRPNEDSWAKEQIPKSLNILWKTLRAGGSKEPFIRTEQGDTIAIKLRQDGRQGGKATPAHAASQTVLGGINSVDFPHAFAAKEEMRSWYFLRLNPEDLREPTKQDAGIRDMMTSSGKNLASTLFRIKQTDPYALKEISRKLNAFLPAFTEVDVLDDKANRQFLIQLKGEGGSWFSSRVLSEGTLRILSLCVLEFDDKYSGLLCFEEPENGIHPFRIKATAQLLKDLTTSFESSDDQLRQVIVNTHSPVLINALIAWQGDKNISVWLSKQNTLITNLDGDRIKLKVSRVSRVLSQSNRPRQLVIPGLGSEEEQKLTLNEIVNYLKTTEAEDAINLLKS
jgi:predicted ATPase